MRESPRQRIEIEILERLALRVSLRLLNDRPPNPLAAGCGAIEEGVAPEGGVASVRAQLDRWLAIVGADPDKLYADAPGSNVGYDIARPGRTRQGRSTK